VPIVNNPNTPQTYPPKFSDKILYPAIYNLDEYTIPTEYDFNSFGVYFNLQFHGYTINASPTLQYGKHAFDINVAASLPSGYPELKPKSRIRFEFKDAAGTVIWSDTTPFYKNNAFTGYVWLRQDPLRTFNELVEGPGTMTVVAKLKLNNPNLKNRYNMRITQPVYIDLISNTAGSYQPNISPILFQSSTGSMASKFSFSEVISSSDGADYSFLKVSASNLMTYGGKIERINTAIRNESSEDFVIISSYGPLQSQSYEADIYKDYGAGLNPISEEWLVGPINDDWFNGGDEPLQVRLTFQNPEGLVAQDPFASFPTDYNIQYPTANDIQLRMEGSSTQLNSRTGTNPNSRANNEMPSTGDGMFHFAKVPSAIAQNSGGQKFNSVGRLTSYGDGKGTGRSGPPTK